MSIIDFIKKWRFDYLIFAIMMNLFVGIIFIRLIPSLWGATASMVFVALFTNWIYLQLWVS